MFEVIGMLLVTAACIFGTAVLDGFVVSKMWEWFVVSTFHLPVLGITQGLGLALTVRVLRGVNHGKRAEKDDVATGNQKLVEAVKVAGNGVLMTLFLLLVGYIVQLFL